MQPGYGGNVFGPTPMIPPNYGTADDLEFVGSETSMKGLFLRNQRRRLNWVPIMVCFALPVILFLSITAVLSSPFRYEQPLGAFLVVLLGAVMVIIAANIAISHRAWNPTGEREPSWLGFLALSLLLAFLLALLLGNSIFSNNTKKYFEMNNLNNYTNIYVDRMRGQQLMDAGMVSFTDNTRLDLTRSMGFKSGSTYCVAPILRWTTATPPKSIQPISYDFWAVGVDCCSGNQADFTCGSFDDPRANGGLRWMQDGSRSLFRLAVQQAEAVYGIQAVHPLFFEWVADSDSIVGNWKAKAFQTLAMYNLFYMAVQAFLVVVATLAFSKIGS